MSSAASATAERELRALLGEEAVLSGATRSYLTDASESHRLRGRADAIALPADADQVAEVVRWCYEHDVPVVPRGGGTGLAGGAVPIDGGVVLCLERLAAAPAIEPARWRARVQAGVRTATLARRAREEGLLFAPDPGAAEQSQLGGNIATNAGGPHAFKYGVTGNWVTGLEVVLAPGETVSIGGPVRKDVAGYDLRSLLVGSEGTLGIITGAWLRLVPAPDLQLPVVAFYPTARAGCRALEAVLGAGLQAAAIEYVDEVAASGSIAAFPGAAPPQPAFMLIAEADGSEPEARRLQAELLEALSPGSLAVHAPVGLAEVRELWRWRAGVPLAAIAARGGKVSEDIVVPIERLADAIEGTLEVGARHGLPACSWGHAGDGNVHATMLVDLEAADELRRAEEAGRDLFELAVSLGGSVSGEHGLGVAKSGALALQWPDRALELHEQIKRLLDPKGLLNPGKKVARA
ncbi:MAG TPA: FAD-linked oxidase C-terminal domain-containing protein [Solirubrobacteraceae bacterium]|nr:FAD-linked oxidase C-terminal domain-containing protein [Solirubrobacteraceae bacterium]